MTKTCFKCQRALPLSEFYAHPMMADGHLGKCKECTRRDMWLHRRNNPERVRASDMRKYRKARECTPGFISRMAEYNRLRAQTHPEQVKAKTAVNNAVRDGRLIKPNSCSNCGKTGCRIDGHHADYSKPLEVQWVCRACHRVLDGHTVTYQTQEVPDEDQ